MDGQLLKTRKEKKGNTPNPTTITVTLASGSSALPPTRVRRTVTINSNSSNQCFYGFSKWFYKMPSNAALANGLKGWATGLAPSVYHPLSA